MTWWGLDGRAGVAMTVTEPQETYDEGEQSSDLNRAIGKQVKVLRDGPGSRRRSWGTGLATARVWSRRWSGGGGLRSGSSWRRRMNCSLLAGC